jgi:UPF0755 protein
VKRPAKRPQTTRKAASSPANAARRSRRPAVRRTKTTKQPIGVFLAALGVTLVLVSIGGLWLWGRSAPTREPDVPFQAVELEANLGPAEVLDRLQAAGVLKRSELVRTYQMILHPWFEYAPGVHWLRPGHSAQELLDLVARNRSRPVVRVVLPEGWDSFQMAERLAKAGICAPEAFSSRVLAARDRNLSPTGSLEGHLYPASYDLRLNSSVADLVERFNKEANTRFQRVFAEANTQAARLERELGLGPDEVVTLASVVEKEAANSDELGLIASVFLNRLRDPSFRPARMLQSDPTAAYGCKVYSNLASCSEYNGRVTPKMLRDIDNPFNTYKHAGLPPTPIGNPSTASVSAVLNAPATDYYFFVSRNGGPHRFSRTLDAHEAATHTR